MCTRYIAPDAAAIERYWQIGRENQPRWWEPDIYPRATGPFIRGSVESSGRALVAGQ